MNDPSGHGVIGDSHGRLEASATQDKPKSARGTLGGHAQRVARLPLLMARDAVATAADSVRPSTSSVRPDALHSAISWLHQTHDVTGRRGSSKGFSLLFGWYPPFPETTGYIIGTLLDYSRRTGDGGADARCIEMGQWEIEVQSPDGGIMQGLLDGQPKPSEAFNTGMVMHGWLDLYDSTGDTSYLQAAERGGDFLRRVQDDDGAWRGQHSYYGSRTHTCRAVAWAQLRLAIACGDDAHGQSAHRHLNWVLSMQRDNGWFDACIFKPETFPKHPRHGVHAEGVARELRPHRAPRVSRRRDEDERGPDRQARDPRSPAGHV